MQRKLQDDLDEVNNKWRSVKENFEKFEDDTKERLEDEKRKVRGESTNPYETIVTFVLRFRGKVLYAPDTTATRNIMRIANETMAFPTLMKQLVELLNNNKGVFKEIADDTEAVNVIKVPYIPPFQVPLAKIN